MEILFMVPEDKLRRFELIKINSGIELPQDLINEALTLFEQALLECKEGRIIVSLNEKTGGFKEFKMTSLEYSRTRGGF